ncbi:MAG TPA: phosphate ABC transporter substrate-binding protein PstS [Thermoleophilia bacterium]|nr:phosphate ABC transporter substrate-binding protein PstS [Thermoleophilia bacterium]
MNKSASPRRLIRAATTALALVVMALAVVACGGSSGGGSQSSADTIVGAGASFPYPLYSKWGEEYAGTGGAKLNYQSIGSGGGISAVKAGTVDFGASDAPLEEQELNDSGLVQFPLCVGGVVPVVNVEGVADGQLKLTADLLARIYNGEIISWNDPAVAAVNAGVTLPDAKINVVHRSDSSGTTWIFTNYLAAAAPGVWKAGADKEVPWPTGVGGKGNEGVAASVQQLSGSIGYVEYAYAKQAAMTSVQMQNKDGAFVAASLEAFEAAAAEADWQTSLPSMYLVLVDQPGATTWPIAGASFILMAKEQQDAARGKASLDFFDWAYTNGAATATSLDYVAIPQTVYDLVQSDVWPDITSAGTALWK